MANRKNTVKTPQGFEFTYRKGSQRPARFPAAWKQVERFRTSAGVFSKRRKISPQALFHDPRNARTVQTIGQELTKLFEHIGAPRNNIARYVEETIEMCKHKMDCTPFLSR